MRKIAKNDWHYSADQPHITNQYTAGRLSNVVTYTADWPNNIDIIWPALINLRYYCLRKQLTANVCDSERYN